eukprot:21395-Heterococcus_DN1.PRE.2
MLAKLGAGQLIRAFEEVLPRMSLGQICTVIAKPHYAYGAAGYPPVVPPNATLIFEIELLGFAS